MRCDRFREGVSARLDGEDAGLPAAMLDAHVASCSACAGWAVTAAEATRTPGADPVPAVADRARRIVATAAEQGWLDGAAAARELRWRWVLGGLGGTQLVVALPRLVLGAGASTHVAHELGSWDVALAIGFLFAALRPSRAWGMLPLVAALVGCLVATAVLDVVEGRATPLHETPHVLEVAGLVALWLLAHRPAREGATPRLRAA